MKTTAEAAAPPADRVRRPRSFKRPLALWFTALLFFVAFLGFVTFIVFGAWMLFSGQRMHGMIALAGMGTFIVARAVASLNARSLTCHLCHGPVLKEKRCLKHHEAKRLPVLGYRSLAVLSALFTGAFRCMYCGSEFRLKR